MCKKLSQIPTASNRQKHLGARGPTYPRGRSWLSAALAAGFSSNITEATGDENEDPFADLDGDFQGLIDQVASGSSVTPQMYIGSDEELPVPVCFNADVNEQQLLESLNTSDQDTIILESDGESDGGEDDNESPPTSRKELPRIS